MNITEIVSTQRAYFQTGATLDIHVRKQALRRLYAAIKAHEDELMAAIHTDLGKSRSEAYMCEVGLTLAEISYTLRHLDSWARPEHKLTPLTNFHAKSVVYKDPYGVVLVMSPWNYPVLLTLQPVVGAVAAGNCVVVKPSAYSPETSRVMHDIITEVFAPEHVACVTGGRAENQTLLDQKWDYIFFTGGVTVGKMVMSKAAENLTPVTLELGGKSPVIVDRSADLRLAARRIVFGKYLNCGQTCIAPDYVLVEQEVHDRFVQLLIEETAKMYGERPLDNPNYGKMINLKHFERVNGLIEREKLVMGGLSDLASLRIAPTILDHVLPTDAVMQEEIFGPVLPVLTVESTDEAFHFIQSRPHPLALYLFTGNKVVEKKFMTGLAFGGGCINDTIIHIATHNLPFGGVGNSGMGSYHGQKSFETFTHRKSVVKKYTWLDLTLRYQPYGKIKDWMVGLFLR